MKPGPPKTKKNQNKSMDRIINYYIDTINLVWYELDINKIIISPILFVNP